MSYIAERRVEEKERRRGEIVDAAEQLYAEKGWDAVTVDQVAKGARLSRALVYVYFRDKEELLYAIGERALRVLRERFEAAVARHSRGADQVEAIGRAYMAYAHEFPHYFDVCSRFQGHSVAPDAGSNEGACAIAGDQAITVVVRAIEAGVRDGSMRADAGQPIMLAMALWAFTHGTIQLATAKATELARFGITTGDFANYTLQLLTQMTAPAKAH